MSLIERFVGNPEGKLEGVLSKAIRHILAGQFDRESIRSGLRLLRETNKARANGEPECTFRNKIDNFSGNPGQTVFHYKIPDIKYPDDPAEIALTEFSLSSSIEALHLNEFAEYELIGDIFKKFPDVIAFFIGPTRAKPSPDIQAYPNNGYFVKGEGELYPFMDTNPPGQRRGALAYTEAGEFIILTENKRLEARDAKFEGFNLVAGTSFYFRNSDNLETIEAIGGSSKSYLSYFVSYADKNGASRFAHLDIESVVSRKTAKQLLDRHAKTRLWQEYVAAELEYMGCGCAFVDQQHHGRVAITSAMEGKLLYHSRSDRYMIRSPNLPAQNE